MDHPGTDRTLVRRLQAGDLVLLAILTPLWLLALSLHLRTAWTTGLAEPPMYVSAPREADSGYPRVSGFYPGREDATDLRMGDRLLQLGDVDLREVGHIRFEALLRDLGAETLEVPVRFERAGRERESEIRLTPARIPWSRVPHVIALGVTCLVILLRAPTRRQARGCFVPWMLFAILSAYFAGGPAWQTYAWKTTQFLLGIVVPPLILGWCLDFPKERRPRSWGHYWPWALAPINAVLRGSYFLGGPVPPSQVPTGIAIADGTVGALCLLALTFNFWRADRIGRRQIKWVLLGVYVGVVPIVVTFLLAALRIALPWHGLLFSLSFLLSVSNSLGVLTAIVRYQLYDIDRLISATASYSVLAVAFLTGVLTLVPRLAAAAGGAIEVSPFFVQLVLSGVLAAIAVPAHRSLRPRIDRLFFPERQALERDVGRLLDDLGEPDEPRELFVLVGEQLDALLRPVSCTIYARAGSGYEPVFLTGSAVPPALEGRSPLITTLEDRSSPLIADGARRRDRLEPLSPFDRAALETLAAVAVVPIRQRSDLVALVCLGRKRSGDIYTSTDVALLSAVANRVSTRLDQFDQDQLVRQARAMQEKLRRYVPGAVAQQVEAGADLEPRERTVSVLFVDVRGYVGYAESRQAHEVFSTVSRYTQMVSTIVGEVRRSRGGVQRRRHDGGLRCPHSAGRQGARCGVGWAVRSSRPSGARAGATKREKSRSALASPRARPSWVASRLPIDRSGRRSGIPPTSPLGSRRSPENSRRRW